VLQAAIHCAWCKRSSLSDPPPWRSVLALYDVLLTHRDDPIVRLNRAVALAEVVGVADALREVETLAAAGVDNFLPYHAVRADLLRRCGRNDEARTAYDAALALEPGPAERLWLERQRRSI
jgi:RNA polymerase sigma-70 factor (ECF subfamily)